MVAVVLYSAHRQRWIEFAIVIQNCVGVLSRLRFVLHSCFVYSDPSSQDTVCLKY